MVANFAKISYVFSILFWTPTKKTATLQAQMTGFYQSLCK